MSTLRVSTLQNASSATANITLDTSGNATVGGTLAMGSSFLRNRIINGDMRIDQRNAGAASASSYGGYWLDRWLIGQSTSGKLIVQQNAGSVTSPVGFTNYFGATSQSAYTVGASDFYQITQAIEGLNISDLAWGTANAKSVTLSFWVRSSLTGTFGGVLGPGGYNYNYPFSYSISAANTWEYKTVTISGPTSGTWLTTNGVGVYLSFGLGAGSTVSGTAGAWAASGYRSATGAVSVVGTNGATFYITGVQLEVGSVATPFERRQYGQELALCQRYYYRITTASITQPLNAVGGMFSSTSGRLQTFFPVRMRTAPSALEQTGTASDYVVLANTAGTALSAVPTFNAATTDNALTDFTVASGGATASYAMLRSGVASAYLGWSAEL